MGLKGQIQLQEVIKNDKKKKKKKKKNTQKKKKKTIAETTGASLDEHIRIITHFLNTNMLKAPYSSKTDNFLSTKGLLNWYTVLIRS